MTTHYMGVLEIARELKVKDSTVRSWINVHDTPEPDVTVGIGGMRGWLPERLDEWRDWYADWKKIRNSNYVRTTWKKYQ